MRTSLGKWLTEQRIRSGFLTQKDLVLKINLSAKRRCSQSLIAQYETGRIKNPNPEILRKICDACGVNFLEAVIIILKEKYTVTDKELKSLPELLRLLDKRSIASRGLVDITKQILKVGK